MRKVGIEPIENHLLIFLNSTFTGSGISLGLMGFSNLFIKFKIANPKGSPVLASTLSHMSPFYLRFSASHTLGTLGKIGTVLGNHDINIFAVNQIHRRIGLGSAMPLSFMVEFTEYRRVYQALAEIERQRIVGDYLPIRIYD